MHTGVPRSPFFLGPAAWVAETSRHTAAQPAFPLARKVTRGSRASRVAPPRVGVRGRLSPPALEEPVEGNARSTPSTGRIPAAMAALTNRTAP